MAAGQRMHLIKPDPSNSNCLFLGFGSPGAGGQPELILQEAWPPVSECISSSPTQAILIADFGFWQPWSWWPT